MRAGQVALKSTKYLFVTGGVVSGLGKGITSASLGAILKARGLNITIQKCDPYLNTDAGTLNPAEHGEVFVTADGAETDLDLGHYERFIDREMTRQSSLMSGQVYAKTITDERQGVFLGKTIQIIPHITNEIQRAIIEAGSGSDVHIVEIGGTVGDYEALAFIEAIRQLRRRVRPENVLYVHVVYLPYLATSKELKTKPAQNTVRDLRELGIHPDIIMARSDYPITSGVIEKLSLFCDVETKAVVPLETEKTVYAVPLKLEERGTGEYITERLQLKTTKADFADWKNLNAKISSLKREVNIGVVAKYMDHEDTYMSVFEAIKAASWHFGARPNIIWLAAEKLGEGALDGLGKLDGIVVPGGFGQRGIEGKILAARYAREHKVPYLGLCLGMQVAVIEFARHVAGLEDANSTEFDEQAKHPVIHIMPDQVGVSKGGTMRLGNYPCVLETGSVAATAYGAANILERHRHRFEFNNDYRDQLTKAGLKLSGLSPDKELVEIVELEDHPFFVGSQFHPEFLSRPNRPHPLFRDFMAAATGQAASTTKARRATAV